MNSRYASGKYSFEIRLSEEVPEGRKEVAQRFIAVHSSLPDRSTFSIFQCASIVSTDKSAPQLHSIK